MTGRRQGSGGRVRTALVLMVGGAAGTVGAQAGPGPSEAASGPAGGEAAIAPPSTGNDPAGPTDIEVVLTEGTNLAASLSPDGRTLAFDLLGRIWTLPAEGGRAAPLTDPFGDARQPQWSPDGSRLVFQAYWSGDYDVWSVRADGSGLEQLTNGPFDDREPTWSGDGERIAFSSDRSGSYDIWELAPSTGALRRLTEGPGNEYTPSFSPDGRTIAYATDGEQAGIWIREGRGDAVRVAPADGAEVFSPSWAPDAASVAYVRIDLGSSGLYVAPVTSSATAGPDSAEPRRLTDDDQDVFPFRATWTSEGGLVYTADGGVRSRPAAGGDERHVDFRAVVTLDREPYRKRLRAFDDARPRPVKGIVSPALSPDGTTVLFVALGDLWSMEIGSEPVRLTDDPFVEVDPAWSPDGSRFAYASDREGETDLYVVDVASGAHRRVSSDGGSGPAWSPDGSEIAYTGGAFADGGVRVLDLETGEARTIRSGLNDPGRPTWSPDGRSVVVSALHRYSTRYREGVNRALLLPVDRPVSQDDGALLEPRGRADTREGRPPGTRRLGSGAPWEGPVALSGTARRARQEGERWLDFARHGSFASRGSDGPVWSPDGRRMAYVASGVLWAQAVSPAGDPVGPPRRLNNEQSSDPSWSGDARSVLYLTTDRLRRVWLESGRIEDVPVPLQWSRVLPDDRYTIHAGEVFDGLSSRLLETVDIVVEGNRIVRVEDHDPALHDGRVIDASDGVVTPGLIEMHMHGGLGAGEQVGRQWLSFGVTTVRTPSADPYEMVEVRESRAVGRRIEPRTFGTGSTVDGSRVYYAGAPALTALGQVELAMEQAEDLSFDLMKTYVRLSDPVQRRVIEASHALGMPVTSHELYPGVAYGADGVEHVKGTSRRGYSPKVSELNRSYQDVVALLAASRMTITPTVGIYGGYAVLAQDDPTFAQDPRIAAFGLRAPPSGDDVDDLGVRRRLVRDMASLGRRVVEAGGTVVVGTDAPINPGGLSLAAEMQILVDYGGMTAIDVMRATTSISARAMGYGAELGRVEAGYLADLLVLGSDPLSDIRAVRDVRMVISDGRTYTVEELLERPDR